jgi:N-acetylglucosamine-6-phosphate deacetylase
VSSLLVAGGTLLTPFEAIEDGAVLARNGVIVRVGARTELAGERADVELDAGGRIICPGFIDLQVNGGGGALLTEAPAIETVERMARAWVRTGTTSILPTAVTADEDNMARALAAVHEAMQRPTRGARVLGAHLEGPFINPVRKGAHDERFIRPPDVELFGRLLAAADGALRLITLAPELPSGHDLIAAARAASVAVSIGHTNATYDEAMRAIEAGAAMGTHLFNGMRPFAQREPGVIGALLESDRVIAGIIADSVHVHPAALALACKAKGPARVALVTDALWSAGEDASAEDLQGRGVLLRGGAWYLNDGTLAGSALSMNVAVRNMRRLAGVPLIDCVRMATATPARVLGMEDEIGVLKPGARADIIVCDDELRVWNVFVGGSMTLEIKEGNR